MQEGLHAFAPLGAGADVGNAARGVVAHGCVDRATGHVFHELLASLHGRRAVGHDRGHGVRDLGVQRLGRGQFMHEAQRMRLRGAEALCRGEVAARGLFTQRAHHIRPDGGGQQAEPGFAQAEVRCVGRHQHVAHRRQTHAAGVAVALDAADDRHRARPQRPQHLRQGGRVGVVLLPAVVGKCAHPRQVGTGAKSLAAATQHDDPQRRVGAQGLEDGSQLRDDAVVEGVAHVRAVEPDLGHAGAGAADVECGAGWGVHRAALCTVSAANRASRGAFQRP